MSLVEWCERQSDPYETTNRISNVAFFVAHARAPRGWFISVVGLGSLYFHISGSYSGELVDELAMSLLAYFYFVDVYGPSPEYAILTAIVWTLYITLGTYNIFVSYFLLQLVTPMYIVMFHKQKTPQQKMDLLKAVVFISAAVYCWGYERYLHANGLCPVDMADPMYYLHSYWHIGTALAHYHFMLVIHPKLKLQNTVSTR